MSDDVRETDRLLGRLVSQAEEQQRQMAAAFRKLDDIAKANNELAGIAKEALRLANANYATIQQDLRPAVERWGRLEAKGAGVLGVVALLGGGAATVIAKVWPWGPGQ
ncbi:MAG: hypothetical protein VW338_00055 [Rhodospirillaceae bacterium]